MGESKSGSDSWSIEDEEIAHDKLAMIRNDSTRFTRSLADSSMVE